MLDTVDPINKDIGRNLLNNMFKGPLGYEDQPLLIRDYFDNFIEESIKYAIIRGKENKERDDDDDQEPWTEKELKAFGKKRVEKFYDNGKQLVLKRLEENAENYLVAEKLGQYSPKYLLTLQNINESPGSVFVYTEYRNLEGLGVFSKILNANGYSRFDVEKVENY